VESTAEYVTYDGTGRLPIEPQSAGADLYRRLPDKMTRSDLADAVKVHSSPLVLGPNRHYHDPAQWRLAKTPDGPNTPTRNERLFRVAAWATILTFIVTVVSILVHWL
jgi:hypothetical protein